MKIFAAIFAASVLLFGPSRVYGDEIILTNGNRLEGVISEESAEILRLTNEYMNLPIDRDNIQEIIRKPYDNTSIEQSLSRLRPLEYEIDRRDSKKKSLDKKSVSQSSGKEQETKSQASLVLLEIEDEKSSAYIPSAYSEDPKKKWPLILAFHGAYGNGDMYLSFWTKAAERFGYIVAAPSASKEFWQVGRDTVKAHKLLGYMKENYRIDSSRVYVCGFSHGGGFVYTLAARFKNELRGLASMMYYLPDIKKKGLGSLDKDFQIYILNGSLDEDFPPAKGEAAAQYFRDKGFRCVRFIDATGIGHAQLTSFAFKIMEYFDAQSKTR